MLEEDEDDDDLDDELDELELDDELYRFFFFSLDFL